MTMENYLNNLKNLRDEPNKILMTKKKTFEKCYKDPRVMQAAIFEDSNDL